MDTKMALCALRARIKDLRGQVVQALKARKFRRAWPSMTVGDQHRMAQAQLSVLVPIYRALVAAMQQGANGTGAAYYRQRIVALRNRLQQVPMASWLKDRWFPPELLAVRLPVPGEGPVAAWGLVSIAEMYEEEAEKVKQKQAVELSKHHAAEIARKRFLDSLSDAQRLLLRESLNAAKAVNKHAVTFSMRDLPK